ncbi:hypothetical protein SKAU_G00429380 [Synaphobranchus kaupii]|uniref:Uncharacterized protein n=1 Tax=Synaphobranchus kaupii TaxID=118154 RepID=A0A9Q1E4F8_SYNKA|nr:hypothetical protein SKAU_G00429380 [Synaphobranchus kaupii]
MIQGWEQQGTPSSANLLSVIHQVCVLISEADHTRSNQGPGAPSAPLQRHARVRLYQQSVHIKEPPVEERGERLRAVTASGQTPLFITVRGGRARNHLQARARATYAPRRHQSPRRNKLPKLPRAICPSPHRLYVPAVPRAHAADVLKLGAYSRRAPTDLRSERKRRREVLKPLLPHQARAKARSKKNEAMRRNENRAGARGAIEAVLATVFPSNGRAPAPPDQSSR